MKLRKALALVLALGSGLSAAGCCCDLLCEVPKCDPCAPTCNPCDPCCPPGAPKLAPAPAAAQPTPAPVAAPAAK